MSNDSAQYIDEQCAYLERAAQVIIGVTISVTAGFLSQVWSSADTAFRLSLATKLEWLAPIFATSILATSVRYIARDVVPNTRYNSIQVRTFRLIWITILGVAFAGNTIISGSIAKTIVKYAAMSEKTEPEPKTVESSANWSTGSWPSPWLRCTRTAHCP